MTKFRKISLLLAAIVKGLGMRRIRSGGPICHSLVKRGAGGKSAESTFRFAVFHPSRDRLNVLIAQSAVVGEVAIAGLGRPRRHIAALCNGCYLRSMFVDILKRNQRKRANSALMVTGCTVCENNGSDILIEGDRLRFIDRLGLQQRNH